MAEGTRIKVAVRVRPFNKRELGLGSPCIVEMSKMANGEQTLIRHGEADERNQHKFTYDHSFWSFNKRDDTFCPQGAVYDAVGKPIVDNALEGFNNTVFAYGQTGSGKTYSMMGNPDDKGLIPRLCDDLFGRISKMQEPGKETAVECAYFEIYNEKVFDLLAAQKGKGEKKGLKVRESPVLGPYVQGLKTFTVSSFDEVDKLLRQGQKSRHTGGTAMNPVSSRSHAIFALTVTQAYLDEDGEKDSDMEKSSKVNLVDLAGSERQSKTMARGTRLAEASSINLSLSTLGMVISALVKNGGVEGKKALHVPYRDSVLTWILRESFGGNAKTVMMATISPALDNYDETLSTLRYADNAKRIVNKAIINEGASAKIIRELKEQIEALKASQADAEFGEGEDAEAKANAAAEAAAELAEAQALLSQQSMSYEERLAATKAEFEKVISELDNERLAAEHRAMTLKKTTTQMRGRMAAMRWRANAHVNAIERKLAEKPEPRGSNDPEVLKARIEEEKAKAQELQDHLDELAQLAKLDVRAMTEYHNNTAEIELLKKFVAQCDEGAGDQSLLVAEIQLIQEKTAAIQSMEPELLALSRTPRTSVSQPGPAASPGGADGGATSVDLTGVSPEVLAKMRAMEEELAAARAAQGGDSEAAAAEADGDGMPSVYGPAAARTSHGQAIFNDLLNRRRAIFAVSRGLKPKGQVCLRTYVIMTCPTAPQVLAEGTSNAMHGEVRLNNVACAGHLAKKGKNRHNWKNRWFLFDLRHRKVVYFEDQTLKKELGYFEMETVMHVLKAPQISSKVDEIEKEKRKFLVVTPKRTWQLMAPTEESRDMWVSVFMSIVAEETAVTALHSDVAVIHGDRQ